MRFSILRTPALNMPLQRVGKAEDLDSAIATALTVRTDFQTQSVQVWENWPPRGREKLRFSAKCGELGGQVITEQLPSWQVGVPPKDGTEIIAIGKVMWQDEFSTTADPFVAAVRWCRDSSNYEGWHYASDGMTVARTLDDKVIIHWWSHFPKEGGAA